MTYCRCCGTSDSGYIAEICSQRACMHSMKMYIETDVKCCQEIKKSLMLSTSLLDIIIMELTRPSILPKFSCCQIEAASDYLLAIYMPWYESCLPTSVPLPTLRMPFVRLSLLQVEKDLLVPGRKANITESLWLSCSLIRCVYDLQGTS